MGDMSLEMGNADGRLGIGLRLEHGLDDFGLFRVNGVLIKTVQCSMFNVKGLED
jgi:hypothetical protein